MVSVAVFGDLHRAVLRVFVDLGSLVISSSDMSACVSEVLNTLYALVVGHIDHCVHHSDRRDDVHHDCAHLLSSVLACVRACCVALTCLSL
jgi:hypothetical protein